MSHSIANVISVQFLLFRLRSVIIDLTQYLSCDKHILTLYCAPVSLHPSVLCALQAKAKELKNSAERVFQLNSRTWSTHPLCEYLSAALIVRMGRMGCMEDVGAWGALVHGQHTR